MSDHDRRLGEACARFVALMATPENGLPTWWQFYRETVLEIARALPAEAWEVLAEEKKEGEQRFVVRQTQEHYEELLEPGQFQVYAGDGNVLICLPLPDGTRALPSPLEVALRSPGPDAARRPKVTEAALDQKLWEASEGLCRHWPYRHLKSGEIYEIDNFAIRESDGEPMVMYAKCDRRVCSPPLKSVMFCRPIAEFRKKFEELK